jgi:lipoyl(octanoyl) transferase
VSVVRVPARVPYAAGLEWQRRLARARIDGRLSRDLLLLLEHEPVVTVGRGVRPEEVRSRVGGALEGIPRFEIERGGDVTYHGPGQLVGYPILDLHDYRQDLHWYVRALEGSLIEALEELGLHAFRVAGYTGVWVGDPLSGPIAAGGVRKIASIGVHVSRWVTWHGFALNVTGEALGPFGGIVPCGIAGVRMTSLETEGAVWAGGEVARAVSSGFARAFGARLEMSELAKLEEAGLGLVGE